MTRGMAWNSMVWLTLSVLASVLMACTDSTEDDTPSMLLSLSAAADTCLADPPDRASISHRGRGQWSLDGRMPIRWSVEGGQPPYSIEVDQLPIPSELREQRAGGLFFAPCALMFPKIVDTRPYGRLSFRYYFSEKPLVDSGGQSVRATVKDATGLKVSASLTFPVAVCVYDDRVLSAGHEYRFPGISVRAPTGFDIQLLGFLEVQGHTVDSSYRLESAKFRLIEHPRSWIEIVVKAEGFEDDDYAFGEEVKRIVAASDPRRVDQQADVRLAIEQALDELLASVRRGEC